MLNGLLIALPLVILQSDLEDSFWLRYRSGDLDSAAALAAKLPSACSERDFLQALTTMNGDSARVLYGKILIDYTGSEAEIYALERLLLYSIAGGDQTSADLYSRLLIERRPDFRRSDFGWGELPDLKSRPPRQSQLRPAESSEVVWRVQTGAFKNRNSAETVGRKVARFGKVRFVNREGSAGGIIAVQVGECASKTDAERLAAAISEATGLQTSVVKGTR